MMLNFCWYVRQFYTKPPKKYRNKHAAPLQLNWGQPSASSLLHRRLGSLETAPSAHCSSAAPVYPTFATLPRRRLSVSSLRCASHLARWPSAHTPTALPTLSSSSDVSGSATSRSVAPRTQQRSFSARRVPKATLGNSLLVFYVLSRKIDND